MVLSPTMEAAAREFASTLRAPYVPMIVAQLFSVVYGRIVSKGV